MKKKDFTPEFVRKKLFNYVVNENFPSELYEIGGKVYITDVTEVVVESVKRQEDNWLVAGTASVETETDMGEGDTMDGSYPMSFGLEFDDDGKIVGAESLEVDNSSFFK